MSLVQEQFQAYPMAANATLNLTPAGGATSLCGGFFCTTAGNFKIGLGANGAGADVIAVFGATVGTFYPIPWACGISAAVVLSGGCAGTFFGSW